MKSRHGVGVGGLVVALTLTACGGSVERAEAAGGAAQGQGGLGGEGGFEGGEGGQGADGGSTPEGFCDEACSPTNEAGCFTREACRATCEAESGGWPAEVRAAFAACAAEDPLCYQTVEGCMLALLHPPGSALTVRLRVSGLEEHVGRTLRVWHDPGTDLPFGAEVLLDGEELELEWVEPVDTGGPLLLAYVDVDGDGECAAAVDVTASLHATWNGDLVAPVYEAALAPPLDDADFVCRYAP